MQDISSKTVIRRYLDSSSFKMAMLFTVILSLSAGILGYFLYDFSHEELMQETEAAIDAEINVLKALRNQGMVQTLDYIKKRNQDDRMVYFRYNNSNGEFIGGNLKKLPLKIKVLSEGILKLSVETKFGLQNLAVKIYTFSDGATIMVARDIDNLLVRYNLLKIFSFLIIGFMGVVLLVSFIISWFVVSRINRIAKTAYDIVDTGDFSQRISIHTDWDDLSNLAKVLNSFLAKIENSMISVREISNNIAHDLRTPLTSLRHYIESLRGRAVQQEDIDLLSSEAERILSIFQSLLRIANIEKGKRHQSLETINLSIILQDVIELYDPLADERKIEIHASIQENLTVQGDADLLFQLFANLLDNAIKFSPSNSKITLTALFKDNQILISIEDEGLGILDHEKQDVFKHFYRSDKSRTLQGNGLGLSLVKAISDYHKAEIDLKDGIVGLLVLLRFESYQNVRQS